MIIQLGVWEFLNWVIIKVSKPICSITSSPVLILVKFPEVCRFCCVCIKVDRGLWLPATIGIVGSPICACKAQLWGWKVTSWISRWRSAYRRPTRSQMRGIEGREAAILPMPFSRLTLTRKCDWRNWQFLLILTSYLYPHASTITHNIFYKRI